MRFVPPLNFVGRASFFFKVTGNDGTSMTNTMGLVITGVAPAQELTWRGDGFANTWNIAAATNWLNGGTPAVFHTGDQVTFDDTGSNSPAINLAAALMPGGLTVASSNDYTFGGSGNLGGAFMLIKSGTDALTLNTSNTFTSGALVNGGVLIFGVAGAAGSGNITLSGGAAQMAAGDFLNPVSLSGSGNLIGNNSVNNTLKGAIDGNGLWLLTIPSGRVMTEESDNSAFSGTIAISGPGEYRLNPMNGYAWGNSNCIYDLGANGVFNNRSPSSTNLYLGALAGGYGSQLRASDQSGSFTDTINVGYLNLDSVFNGVLGDGTGTIAHQLALNKSGTGALTLRGTNTGSGNITLNSGTLIVGGISGNGPVIVAAGAMLAGTGIIGGNLTAQSSANVSPGDSPGNAGTLNVSGNLNLTAANLRFDLANTITAGGGVNDLILLGGGAVNLSGLTTVVPNLVNGVLASGDYTLVTGGSSTTGTAANLAWGGVAGTRQNFTFDLTASGTVKLHVTGSPAAALIWQGTNGNNWDLATTNWMNGPGADKFYNSDSVTFDDTSTNGNVTISAAVQPGTVIVNNSANAYHWSGGAIIGGASFIKTGNGTLTIASSNTFGGGVTINDGLVLFTNDLANFSGLGTGTITLNGGTLGMFDKAATTNIVLWNLVVPTNATGTLYADSHCDFYGNLAGGGDFNFRVISNQTSLYGDWSAFTGSIDVFGGGEFRVINSIGYPGAAINLFNNVTADFQGMVDPNGTTLAIGELSGAGSSQLRGGTNVNGEVLTWRIGGKNTDAIFAGQIGEQDNAANTAVEKTGTGNWTLTGSNNYNGGTLVSGGTLVINALNGSATGSGDVEVGNGATLAGTGTASGSLFIDAGAALVPGNPAGTLDVGTDLNLDPAATVQFTLGNSSASVSVAGTLSAAGALKISDAPGFGAGSYAFFNYSGVLFYGGFNLVSAPAGYSYSLNTNTAGIVKLTVAQLSRPQFAAVTLMQTNIIFAGTNGATSGLFYLLGSTNLLAPLSQWRTLATNQFDAAGSFILTNAIDPKVPAQFYLLQVP